MVAVVNTNVMSLNAQRQLNKSQNTQNQAMERLSSGLRINSAKDDAAGLAISTGFNSQIKGITQAVRNANDGVSMAQTAEGSMDEMTNILQRMRELSVQSANDTNSSDNRASIQKEVDQLHSELDRIAESTEFNGTKLLNGSGGETTLQIGANSGQTLSFSIDSVTTNDLGLNSDLNKGDLNGGRAVSEITASSIDVNGVSIGGATAIAGNTALANANAINEKTAQTGVTANTYNVVEGAATDANGKPLTGVTDGTMSIQVGSAEAVTLGATGSMDNLVETINRDVDGVNASLNDKGGIVLTNDTGADIVIANAGTSGLGAGGKGYVSLTSTDGSSISINDKDKPGVGIETAKAGFIASNSAGSVITDTTTVIAAAGGLTKDDAIQINGVDLVDASAVDQATMITAINKLTDETGVTAVAKGTGFQLTNQTGEAVNITSGADGDTKQDAAMKKMNLVGELGGQKIDSLGTNVSTVAGATNSIDLIDKALGKISESRASLGAIQNRLGSTVSNLENVSQNLAASNSRIQDADFAAETSKMSKAQILQQAGTSMLSQANASAQSVLSLLG
tara:strand:+ start:305 stop:2008 length:1704 start_codon:yes stop_codon:yes gene_type:complete